MTRIATTGWFIRFTHAASHLVNEIDHAVYTHVAPTHILLAIAFALHARSHDTH